MVSILNYDKYQDINTPSNAPSTNEQQGSNKPSTSDQQVINKPSTSEQQQCNKAKNAKKDKKNKDLCAFDEFWELYPKKQSANW